MQFLKIFLFLFILTASKIFAQFESSGTDEIGIFLGMTTGISAYDINSVIDARNSAVSALPFKSQITDNYPHNPFFQGELLLLFDQFELGFKYSMLSTGTRVYYADYSGEYKYDNVISYYQYGLLVRTPGASESHPLKFQLAGEIGSSKVKINSTEYLKVFDKSETKFDNFTENILYFGFGANLNYYFKGFIATVGACLILEHENSLTINFQGLRGLVTLGYRID